MPYINNDGTVGGRKPFLRLISDFFQGIIDFVSLFFGAITNPPQRIESRATVSCNVVFDDYICTSLSMFYIYLIDSDLDSYFVHKQLLQYGQRNNGRSYTTTGGRPAGGSNIRGVKNLGGNCEARMGGG